MDTPRKNTGTKIAIGVLVFILGAWLCLVGIEWVLGPHPVSASDLAKVEALIDAFAPIGATPKQVTDWCDKNDAQFHSVPESDGVMVINLTHPSHAAGIGIGETIVHVRFKAGRCTGHSTDAHNFAL